MATLPVFMKLEWLSLSGMHVTLYLMPFSQSLNVSSVFHNKKALIKPSQIWLYAKRGGCFCFCSLFKGNVNLAYSYLRSCFGIWFLLFLFYLTYTCHSFLVARLKISSLYGLVQFTIRCHCLFLWTLHGCLAWCGL